MKSWVNFIAVAILAAGQLAWTAPIPTEIATPAAALDARLTYATTTLALKVRSLDGASIFASSELVGRGALEVVEKEAGEAQQSVNDALSHVGNTLADEADPLHDPRSQPLRLNLNRVVGPASQPSHFHDRQSPFTGSSSHLGLQEHVDNEMMAAHERNVAHLLAADEDASLLRLPDIKESHASSVPEPMRDDVKRETSSGKSAYITGHQQRDPLRKFGSYPRSSFAKTFQVVRNSEALSCNGPSVSLQARRVAVRKLKDQRRSIP